MADLYHVDETPQHICWDRKYYNTFEENVAVLKGSRTVYVGNLSFFTTELQIEEIFATVGPIKRIIMGLNSITKTPCGFCFVEYYTHEHAAQCLKHISGTICDERIIRCDLDTGFKPGRQYGRGASGGQVIDERRAQHGAKHDPGRGGVVQLDPATAGKKRRHEDRSIADLLNSGLSSSRASKETQELIGSLNGSLSTPRYAPPPPPPPPPRVVGSAHVPIVLGMAAPARVVHMAPDNSGINDDEDDGHARKKRG
jgi:nuclear cap-binding protein subunit 2